MRVVYALARSSAGAGKRAWIAAVLLLAGGAAAGFAWSQRAAEAPVLAAEGLPAHEVFDAGLAALRAGEWREARALFEEAARLEPEAEEATRYARHLAKEEAAAVHAERARRCLDEGDVDCALAEVGRIGSEGLVYEREGRALRLRIAAALGNGADEPEGEDAAAAPGEGMAPAVSAGREGPRQAARAVGAVGRREGSGASPGQQDAALPPPSRRRAAAPAPPRSPDLERARAALARGDLAGAAAALAASEEGRARASELERLQQVLDAGRVGPAELPILRQGLATVRGLGGSPALEARIREKLALGSAQQGHAAFALGDLRAAYRLFREARGHDPESRDARRGLELIRGRAHGLMVEGYALRTRQPEAAREKLRLAMELSAAGEEVHEKAKKWLATLDEAS